jgi:hypothetical protein
MSRRKRPTPARSCGSWPQADQLLAAGKDVADVCRELQVVEAVHRRARPPLTRMPRCVRSCGLMRGRIRGGDSGGPVTTLAVGLARQSPEDPTPLARRRLTRAAASAP